MPRKKSAADWNTARDPEVLLRLVSVTESGQQRRWRLYGCACARQVWHLLTTEARSAVRVSEQLADGQATPSDLRAAALRIPAVSITPAQLARTAAAWATGVIPAYARGNDPALQPEHSPREAARYAARALAAERVGPAPVADIVPPAWHVAWMQSYDQARATQAALLRAIFPPPGYTPRLNPAWVTATVLALARRLDQTDDPTAAPILADALQEAGCDDPVILDRCRSAEAVPTRGNWVVDLLLGRQ